MNFQSFKFLRLSKKSIFGPPGPDRLRHGEKNQRRLFRFTFQTFQYETRLSPLTDQESLAG